MFDFAKGQGGTVTIQDFAPDDKVRLTGFRPEEAEKALDHQQNQGGSTTITLSDQTKITFVGLGHLNPTNFG